MVALPNNMQALAFEKDLHQQGFLVEDVLHFGADEGRDDMAKMLDGASDFAGFGYEITLMRRYLDLSSKGCRWVLVYAPEDDQAEKVQAAAQRYDSPMAVKYHSLAVEDLI
ncbi:MAG: hypothetical protein ABIO45_18635 [Burkholderiaceae bacterium]